MDEVKKLLELTDAEKEALKYVLANTGGYNLAQARVLLGIQAKLETL